MTPETGQTRPLSLLSLSLLAVVVGALAGGGAIAFRLLIAFFHNLLFLGKLSFDYNARAYTAISPWGPLVILIPAAGAIGVAFLVKNFAPEAKGRGVPEVMDAVYYNRGVIRPIVALVKSIASSLSIGSGGSAGREGPIVQIGSTFGSVLSQILRTPTWERITLVACGAAGGISATFNSPIGGVLFAVELTMHEVSARTLVPVVLSASTATYVGRAFFGNRPSFVVPEIEVAYFHLESPLLLIAYVGLGLLVGLAAALYTIAVHKADHFFDDVIRGSYYRRHIIGMLFVGAMMYALMRGFGHYYVEGVGYATIQDILSGMNLPLELLVLLFFAKLLATSATLGSGASGGIFSPGLYLGATLGATYGSVLHLIFPGFVVSKSALAIAAMAGLFGGSTGAALTAITMLFEMTQDYNAILPITITVAISYGLRRAISRETIYTLGLVERGHDIPDALRANLYYKRPASSVMNREFGVLRATATVHDLERSLQVRPNVSTFLVEEQGRVIGVMTPEATLEILETAETSKIGDIVNRTYAAVSEGTPLLNVLGAMNSAGASAAIVCSGRAPDTPVPTESVEGVIGESEMAEAVTKAVGALVD